MQAEKLRQLAHEYIEEHSIQELAKNIDVSRTQLSLWLSKKYKSNPAPLQQKLSLFFGSISVSRSDERILQRITELLHHAENRENIVAALALRR